MPLHHDTLERFISEVRPYLARVAGEGRTITYKELQIEFHLPRQQTGEIVGKISEMEFSEDRPLLSAIVVRKDTRLPGVGFFGLPVGIPQELGWQSQEPSPSSQKKARREAFARREQVRVFNFWRQNRDVSSL